MNIKQLIKENYEIAKSKGFYPKDSKIEDHLMGIVSELGEAYEAHRGGKFAKPSLYTIDELATEMEKNNEHFNLYKSYFVSGVKDSFEDELADVFIRLFNLCGHYVDPMNYDVVEKNFNRNRAVGDMEVSEMLFRFQVTHLKQIFMDLSKGLVPAGELGFAMKGLYLYCEKLNIPIEKHIKAKMEYNKTREHLHGKQY